MPHLVVYRVDVIMKTVSFRGGVNAPAQLNYPDRLDRSWMLGCRPHKLIVLPASSYTPPPLLPSVTSWKFGLLTDSYRRGGPSWSLLLSSFTFGPEQDGATAVMVFHYHPDRNVYPTSGMYRICSSPLRCGRHTMSCASSTVSISGDLDILSSHQSMIEFGHRHYR